VGAAVVWAMTAAIASPSLNKTSTLRNATPHTGACPPGGGASSANSTLRFQTSSQLFLVERYTSSSQNTSVDVVFSTSRSRYTTSIMHKAQAVGIKKQVLIRFLMLLVGSASVAALLLWLKTTAANALSLSFPNALQDFITLTLSVVIEALPFVILGALVSVFIRLFATTQRFVRLLPKRPLLRRLSISLLGSFMPVCECGNMPVARGLVFTGFSVAESTTFLLAAPILNPITLLTTSQAFRLDPSIVWIRMGGALLIANLVGGLIALYKDQMELVSKSFYNTLCKVDAAVEHQHDEDHDEGHHHDHHHHSSRRWQEGVVMFREEVSLMLKMLCLGGVIAGLTQVFVPRDVLTGLGGHPVFSVLAMIALAFIVSLCSNVDAFFALAYSSTFTAGSIVAFLVFGPLIDIKMLALMRTTYKTWLLAAMTLVVALSSILIGLAVNYAL
jgi:uncharacterized membrane protein YraQ (UPF0718 family)